jgi:hypothetical protein
MVVTMTFFKQQRDAIDDRSSGLERHILSGKIDMTAYPNLGAYRLISTTPARVNEVATPQA